MNINKALIYGRITNDIEPRQLPSGAMVVSVGVATNRRYTNKDGEKQEEVEYHNVVFFGKLAELVNQYLSKGSPVFVEGRLRTSSWEDNGVKKYRTEIVAENMQFGPKGQGGGDSESRASEDIDNSKVETKIDPDDIPF